MSDFPGLASVACTLQSRQLQNNMVVRISCADGNI